MTGRLAVAAVQHDIVWEDAPATRARLEPAVAAAAGAGARLVVLSEMFAVGFSMAATRLAEDPGGPTEAWMQARAARHDVWLCGSVPQRADGHPRPTNRLLLVAPDGTVHRYAKRHPFSYGGESEHYSAGSDLLTVDVEGVRVTPFVCYDLRFAPDFWAAAPGTDCFVVVANWPASRREHWRTLLRARAVEDQAYVVGVNRVGSGDGLDYVGDSCIVDPLGQVLAEASHVETVLRAEVDAAEVASVRARFPFMADRREPPPRPG